MGFPTNPCLSFFESYSRQFVLIRVHSRLALSPWYSVSPCLRGEFWIVALRAVEEWLFVCNPHLVHNHAVGIWVKIAVKLNGIGELVV